MRVKLIISALALIVTSPAHAETLTNTSVVALVKSGVGDEVIIAVIERSEVRFDLSTDQIISLKRQGVPPAVLAAMIRANDAGDHARMPARDGKADRGSVPPVGTTVSIASIRSPGVYLISGTKAVRIDPSASSQLKTGGVIGAALTGGIVSASMKAVISGDTARTKTSDANPTFYFYFGSAAQDGAASWTASGTPTSPNEFSLVRLKSKSGRREAKVGKMGITGAKVGVMDKDRIDFTYDEVKPGMFMVKPGTSLSPGEYAFIATIGAGGAMSARIFDFSVQ